VPPVTGLDPPITIDPGKLIGQVAPEAIGAKVPLQCQPVGGITVFSIERGHPNLPVR